MTFCFMTNDVLHIKTILFFDVARNHEIIINWRKLTR